MKKKLVKHKNANPIKATREALDYLKISDKRQSSSSERNSLLWTRNKSRRSNKNIKNSSITHSK